MNDRDNEISQTLQRVELIALGLRQDMLALRSDLHFLATKADLLTVSNQLKTMAATLDQVLADVTEESTVIDSLTTLLAGIKKQLDDALSGANLPPAVQAKVDAIFTQAETNKQKLADAVTANTPAA